MLEQGFAAKPLPGTFTDALTALKDDDFLMNMMGSPMRQASSRGRTQAILWHDTGR
jgi:hypothetical protein